MNGFPATAPPPAAGGGFACASENGSPTAVIHASGTLTYATVPELRRAVLNALTNGPELLLVDVSGLEVVDDLTLTALPMLADQGGAVDATVMLYGPSPVLAEQLDTMAVRRQVPTFGTQEQARAAYRHRPAPRRVRLALDPVPASTARARRLVDEACAGWRIPHLADTAALIATELVANAVQHAGTPVECSLTLRPAHLHIAARDHSAAPPVCGGGGHEDGGRGLLIVDALAASWGHVATADGKVVWATLRRRPAGGNRNG
jgi:anti-anti-sigma regulatory factor